MEILVRLLSAFGKQGYQIRSGLNPYYLDDPDAAFTLLCKDGNPLGTGGGLAPLEILFLAELLKRHKPTRNVLVIGNAFGWSSLAAAMATPHARVVAMEANIEGEDVVLGTTLTHAIAAAENLDVRVVDAISPEDVTSVANNHLAGDIDFVLVDGLHTNRQLIRDFEACLPHAAPHCLFFLHDVLNWHMLEAFEHISRHPRVAEAWVLPRLPSGVGIVTLQPFPPEIHELASAFREETIDFDSWRARAGATVTHPGPLTERLSRGYPLAPVHEAIVASLHCPDAVRLANIQRGVAQSDGHAPAIFLAASHLLEHGLLHEAAALFRQTIEQAPDWPDPYYQLSQVLRRLGTFSAALPLLEKLRQLAPERHDLWAEQAILHHQANEMDAARRCCHELAKREPILLENVVRYLIGNDTFGNLLAICIDLQETFPNTRFTMWDLLDPLLESDADPEEVASALRTATQHHPRVKVLWKLLGIALRRQNSLREALAAFESALQLVPDWPSVLVEAGRTHLLLKEAERAGQYFKRALAVRPDFNAARLHLADCE